MNKELYDEAVRSNVLSKALISTLLESMNYSSISFINWTVEVLKVLRTRLERGDKIIDEVSGITYDLNSFHKFVKTNFSSYNMIMTDSSKNKTYKWISSLSERFSLVEMIATGIVYLKDIKTNTYQPFISGNGKYCRYDSENGQIVEL